MQLYQHQIEGREHILSRDASAIMAEPGTGKTLMTLSALMEVDRFVTVVLCPVSVRRNWLREIEKHWPDYDGWAGIIDSQKAIDKAYEAASFSDRMILVAGIESLSSGATFKRLWDFMTLNGNCWQPYERWLICDESHLIKNYASARTKRATKLASHFQRRVTLTGTPTTGKLIDLFAQFRFLEESTFGKNLTPFKNRYCIMGGFENREIVGYQNVGEMMETIDPLTFRARKEDCLDLPPKVYETREVSMGVEQRRAYVQAVDNLTLAIEDKAVGIQNALELALRCSQISSGILKVDDEEHWLPAPKIIECAKLVDDVTTPVVIWSCFRSEQVRMYEELQKKDHFRGHVAMINGDTSPAKRDEIVQKFQARQIVALIATPAAGGIGINLTAADTQIFLSNTYSATHRIQAEDRLHRVGQDHTVTIIDIVCGQLDARIAQVLVDKKDIIDGILRPWRDKV